MTSCCSLGPAGIVWAVGRLKGHGPILHISEAGKSDAGLESACPVQPQPGWESLMVPMRGRGRVWLSHPGQTWGSLQCQQEGAAPPVNPPSPLQQALHPDKPPPLLPVGCPRALRRHHAYSSAGGSAGASAVKQPGPPRGPCCLGAPCLKPAGREPGLYPVGPRQQLAPMPSPFTPALLGVGQAGV